MGVVVFSSRVSEAMKFAVYVLCAKPCKGTEDMDDVVFSSEMSEAKMLLQILFALSLVRAKQTWAIWFLSSGVFEAKILL